MSWAWRHPGYLIAVGVVALLLIVGTSLAVFGYFVPRPVAGYYFPVFPFGFFWVFIALFLVFGVSRWVFWGWGWRRRGYYDRHYDSAHQILRERYARGEITKEQMDQMASDLDRDQH